MVFFHSPVPKFQFVFGWAGVNLFFILSGFLITRSRLASKEQPGLPFFTHFYRRRVYRLFPVIICILLFPQTYYSSLRTEILKTLKYWKVLPTEKITGLCSCFVYNLQEVFNALTEQCIQTPFSSVTYGACLWRYTSKLYLP